MGANAAVGFRSQQWSYHMRNGHRNSRFVIRWAELQKQRTQKTSYKRPLHKLGFYFGNSSAFTKSVEHVFEVAYRAFDIPLLKISPATGYNRSKDDAHLVSWSAITLIRRSR